jgi:hypothetical protein
MTSRFFPYATTPGRFVLQLLSDVLVVAWTVLWVMVGLAVHAAVSTIAEFGSQVEHGANGIGGNLDSAGHGASKVPLIGDELSKPLAAAGRAAHDIGGAGHDLHSSASWLAVLLALAVAAPPIGAIAIPWLVLRLRFFARKWRAIGLAATPAGVQLLALRALANRPLRRLVAVDVDPAGAWRREDAVTIHRLAAVELRAAGVAAPPGWR